jgi:prolyl-tRNA editing enzyme YbaK/EbsC (Cys-tRNA(Pro) deacylase)
MSNGAADAADAAPAGGAPAALGEDHLLAWIDAHGVSARLVVPGSPTPTVPEAAAALGVAVDDIVKSLVFLVCGEPWLVMASGESRIRYPALAAAWGVSRRRVRLATPAEALSISGYPVGAMPPFGHRSPLPALADRSVTVPGRTLYAGGGTREALLEVTSDELLRVTAATPAELIERPDGGNR